MGDALLAVEAARAWALAPAPLEVRRARDAVLVVAIVRPAGLVPLDLGAVRAHARRALLVLVHRVVDAGLVLARRGVLLDLEVERQRVELGVQRARVGDAPLRRLRRAGAPPVGRREAVGGDEGEQDER